MSKSRDILTSLLHRLGVAGPARVRAFQGSGAPKITPRRLVLPALAATLGALVFTSAPALAAAPEPPETPQNLKAAPIAATTATLNGVLNPGKEGDPGTYEFRYRKSASECEGGTSEEDKATSVLNSLGGKEEAAKAPIAELLPHTAYTFCLRAHNEAGEESALAGPVTFTTLAAPPKIEEQFSTDVASSSVTLNALVNPGGAATTYRFEYAPVGGAFVPVAEPEGTGSLPAGTVGVALSVHVQRGLLPGVSYEFRLVVSNSVATVTGEPVLFATQRVGGEFALPDGRRYEMVTPPQKEGALFEGIDPIDLSDGSNLVQASVAGNAIVDLAGSPSESEPQGYADGVSVLSTRGSAGWSSQVIAPPHDQGAGVGRGVGEYRLFSEDLSAGVVQPFGQFSPYSPEATELTPYVRTDYLGGNVEEHCQSSCFRPLVTRANDTASPFVPFGGGGAGGPGVCVATVCGPEFVGASADLSHVVVKSPVQLTATPGAGLYEWSAGRLQLVGVLPAGEEGSGEPQLAGGIEQPDNEGESYGAKRAVSESGERVLFVMGIDQPTGLFLRNIATSETVRLDVPQGSATGSSEGLEYMTASSDASRVFFLDEGHLTAQSSASGNDLYEYDLAKPEGERLTDLTVDPRAGEAAGVAYVLGTSNDGSYVYFAAGGVLAPGAVPAVPGKAGTCSARGNYNGISEGCNIYVRHDGQTRLVAAGWISGHDAGAWSRVSPDGRWLAFMSSRSLTGYDNRDANNGQPDAEVYLYHAELSGAGGLERGELTCASCDPTGVRPVGVNDGPVGDGWVAGNVPGWTWSFVYQTRYQSRYLSDSGRLFFESYGALVPRDVNGVGDVYEYEPEGVPAGANACSSGSASGSEVFRPARAFSVGGVMGEEGAGCVALVSSGTSSEASTFLDASETGGDVFFLTASKLVSQDVDTAPDVYDAHECTEGSPCLASATTVPPPCTTEASCKAPPTPQPEIFGPTGSATFSGPGNLVSSSSSSVVKPAVKSLTRAQRLTAALKICRNDKRKAKRAACEGRARKKYGVVKPGRARKSANTDRGARR